MNAITDRLAGALKNLLASTKHEHVTGAERVLADYRAGLHLMRGLDKASMDRIDNQQVTLLQRALRSPRRQVATA